MTHAPPRPGTRLRSGKLADLDTQGTYTPVLEAGSTDPDLGSDGAAEGIWHRSGHLVTEWVRFEFGTSGVDAGSGSYRIQPFFPVDFSLFHASTSYGHILGSVFARDDSAANYRVGVIQSFSSSGNGLLIFRVDGVNFFTESTPWTWAAEDSITAAFTYLADPASLPTGGGS